MKIIRQWLERKGACQEGKEWFLNEGITNPVDGVMNLMDKGKDNWANWLIIRLLTRKQQIQYAVFAAEQVIDLYEKKYADDKRPRLAIEAAKKCIKSTTTKNRNADAADAAYAANAAAYAANAAAYAAYAANAAAYAANAAAYAANAAAMKRKVVLYGVKLFQQGDK